MPNHPLSLPEARDLLGLHTGMFENWAPESGLLGSLRPYRGLRDEDFGEVVEAMLALGDQCLRPARIDPEVVLAVWQTCHYIRWWGTDEDSLLRQNNLLAREDLRKLRQWELTIERIALGFLKGLPISNIAHCYASYVAEGYPVGNPESAAAIVAECLNDPDKDGRLDAIAALVRLGRSVEAVPSLLQRLLADSDEEVRAAAESALREIAA